MSKTSQVVQKFTFVFIRMSFKLRALLQDKYTHAFLLQSVNIKGALCPLHFCKVGCSFDSAKHDNIFFSELIVAHKRCRISIASFFPHDLPHYDLSCWSVYCSDMEESCFVFACAANLASCIAKNKQ